MKIDFSRRKEIVLALVSLAICVGWLALAVGICNTPSNTTDSKGHGMGFKDPLSAEHYWIMLQNATWRAAVQCLGWYDWLFVAAHFIGLGILFLPKISFGLAKYFFALQLAFFPFGLLGILIIPQLGISLMTFSLDREDLTDWPSLSFTIQGIWIIASMCIFRITSATKYADSTNRAQRTI